MTIKLIGAIMIVLSCGSVGFYLSAVHRQEEEALRQLICALDYMGCELQYRMTPLPELCRSAAAQNRGVICRLFLNLANELDSHISPDVSACMTEAIAQTPKLPDKTTKLLLRLGGSLGRFDMSGQIRGMENMRQLCRKELDALSKDRTVRLRNYQTLALCAGVALAILLM